MSNGWPPNTTFDLVTPTTMENCIRQYFLHYQIFMIFFRSSRLAKNPQETRQRIFASQSRVHRLEMSVRKILVSQILIFFSCFAVFGGLLTAWIENQHSHRLDEYLGLQSFRICLCFQKSTKWFDENSKYRNKNPKNCNCCLEFNCKKRARIVLFIAVQLRWKPRVNKRSTQIVTSGEKEFLIRDYSFPCLINYVHLKSSYPFVRNSNVKNPIKQRKKNVHLLV